MDWIHHILYGFQVTFIPINLLFCGIGVVVGTLVGVLPGIGPTAAMALLLPVTFQSQHHVKHYHALRYSLRLPIRRIYDLHTG